MGLHRARLRLNDSFKRLQGAVHAGDATEYPVAHGITVSSEHATILNAISAGHKLNIGQAGLRQAEELRSSWLVMGAHVLPDTLTAKCESEFQACRSRSRCQAFGKRTSTKRRIIPQRLSTTFPDWRRKRSMCHR